MRAVLLLALLLVAPALAPAASADHPGSVLGLARFEQLLRDPLGNQQLVHRITDVDAAFAEWESTWPDLVERSIIGETSSGQPLLNVRVTDETVPYDAAPLSTGHKLRVYLDGGHHGNEYLGVELVMYYLRDLLEKAEAGDEATRQLLRETEVYATPIINVDGNTVDTRKNGRQVDPNRNYDFQWGGEGAGKSVTDLNYHGPAPFSEAEVKANAEFGHAIRPDLWITMHTGVAEFYWPWGWTMETAPDDVFFSSLEKPFEEATRGRVDAMQSAELYVAAGATDDYGYAMVGAPTFTYEVHEDQFIPVYGEPIPDVIADQLAGLDFMVRNVSRMGAWVDVVLHEGQWWFENQGWGIATNLTATALSDDPLYDPVLGTLPTALVPALQPGERAPIPAELGERFAWEYPVLLVNTSKIRQHAMDGVVTTAGAPANATPGAGAGLVVLAVAALALARRR